MGTKAGIGTILDHHMIMRDFGPENSSGNPELEEKFRDQREEMVGQQLRRRGIYAENVLAAMNEVRRHEFVPPEGRDRAYADGPLSIGDGQTISQPLIVAVMASALELTGIERVLDVGTGSGYNAAVLSHLAREVFSIERHASLADAARERLTRLGYRNVLVVTGDGSEGWPEAGPFDAIVVAAAAPGVPKPLGEQLAEGGRLVIPVGGFEKQDLLQIIRQGQDFVQRSLCPCRFVPLTGHYGWEPSPAL
jgi:protein-L-isoaspartate(D-aspartate) O-methyltransferase